MIEFFSSIYEAINHAVGGNEFASGALITGLSGVAVTVAYGLGLGLRNFVLKNYTTTMIIHSSDSLFNATSLELAASDSTLRVFSAYGYKAKQGQSTPFTKAIGEGFHFLFYKSSPLIVRVSKIEKTGAWEQQYEMRVQKLGKSHKLFNDVLSAASTDVEAGYVKVYKQNSSDGRSYITSQKQRSMSSVFLPEAVEQALMNAITNFKTNEEWYVKNNLPYQLGILIHGVPGSGKTTLARAICSLFPNRDIVIATNPSEFKEACLTSSGVIIAEEIDTMMIANRDSDSDDDTLPSALESLPTMVLGNLLSALDGVIHNHGRLFIATTNNKDALDTAMLRPGRIDLVIELNHMDTYQFKSMIRHFFGVEVSVEGMRMKIQTTPVYLQQDIVSMLNQCNAVNRLCEKYLVRCCPVEMFSV